MQSIVVILLIFLCSIGCLYGKFNENFCDKTTFYKPYIRVYNEKGGDLIFEAENGFRTLQSVSNSYMCINGPALLYSDIEATTDGERVFQDVKFGLFVHDCTNINSPRITPSPGALPKCNTSRVTTTQQMFANPTNSAFIPPSPDFTVRLWGVYMLGSRGDYRQPQLLTFNDKNFEMRSDLVFGVDHSRSPPRAGTFRYGLSFVSIGNVSQCLNLPTGAVNLTLPRIMNPENQICFRPQTATDPDFVANLTTVDANGTVIFPEVQSNCNESTSDLSFTGCTELPNPEDECKRKRPNSTLTCEIMKIIIGEVVPSFPPELMWHVDVLEILGEIFMTVCPAISRHFLTTVSTLTNYYVSTAFKSNTSYPTVDRRPFWPFIMKSLRECKSRVTPFRFNDIPFKSVAQYKKDIIFRNLTSSGDTNVRLFYFTEFADREYEFNRIIDMEWTIFATVLGICSNHYNTRTASISSRLYTMFSEDFLLPLSDIWIDPSHNQVYELLLGQFINDEVKIKAESCLEAAYVQSNTLAFRYPRPLTMNCGQDDNFFLELPTPQFYTPRK